MKSKGQKLKSNLSALKKSVQSTKVLTPPDWGAVLAAWEQRYWRDIKAAFSPFWSHRLNGR